MATLLFNLTQAIVRHSKIFRAVFQSCVADRRYCGGRATLRQRAAGQHRPVASDTLPLAVSDRSLASGAVTWAAWRPLQPDELT